MKIGILADIHGNIRALESVIDAFRCNRVEEIVCIGDMIGYYHNSLEVLDLLRRIDAKCILGNHESYLLGSLKCSSDKWQECFLDQIKKTLSTKHLSWLSAIPEILEINKDNCKIVFFHGSPWGHLEEYIYPDYKEFNRFSSLGWDYIFLGHTHYQMKKNIGNINVINPGSCGQPRDGVIGAKAVIFDLKTGELKFINKPYDIDKTINEAKIAGVPEAAIRLLEAGK